MDDRQTKIREGAGLEDSRVNQEFVDFLKKWSSPVLMVFAFAALAWAGMQYLERQKVAKVDNAFSQLASATQGGNPSDSSLKAIASEFAGTRSVPELALLMTTDMYLNAFVSGYDQSAEIDAQTGLPKKLNDAQRQVYLDEAGKVANQVLESTRNVAGKELLAMQAMSRLASVKEGKRDFDGAKGMYQSLETMATAAKYPSVANFAAARILNLDSLKDVAALPSEDDLVSLPGELSLKEIQEMIDSIDYEEPVDAEVDAETDAVDPIETSSETPVESSSETPAEEPESP